MFTLDQVVPWGRSFDEYRRMFALTDADLQSRILGCADGPASFNAEATRQGASIVSCDPLYQSDAAQIRERIDATFDVMLEQTRNNHHEFVWTMFPSLEALAAARQSAMDIFLADYDEGQRDGRYVNAALPSLPFPDGAFDLALCSHFLFLYSQLLDEAFHVAGMRELRRVAREVRVFPLLALGGKPSPHVGAVIDAMRADGHDVAVLTVAYEFQRGANQMLRIV